MAAGNTFAVLQGIGYWAPTGTAIPGPHLAYGDPMPTGWNPIVDTVNGYQVTFRNPRAAITSEERGRIGQVPAGDEGTAIALQFRSIEYDLLKKISALQSRTLASRTQSVLLVLSGTASAGGNAVVDPGGTPVSIALASSDTAAQAATKVAAGTYTGWTATVEATSGVRFVATAAGRKGAPSVTGLPTGLTGAWTNTTLGINETEVGELDKNVDMSFMLAVEGIATAGSFFDEERWIRYVFYNVENTANADHILRHSGADAAFAPNATLEALPIPNGFQSSHLLNTGLTAADLDANLRGNYFAIDTEAA